MQSSKTTGQKPPSNKENNANNRKITLVEPKGSKKSDQKNSNKKSDLKVTTVVEPPSRNRKNTEQRVRKISKASANEQKTPNAVDDGPKLTVSEKSGKGNSKQKADPSDHAVMASAVLPLGAFSSDKGGHRASTLAGNIEIPVPAQQMDRAKKWPHGEPSEIPKMVVPIYDKKEVLLKLGDSFLRVGNGDMPSLSKRQAPIYLNSNEHEIPDRFGRFKKYEDPLTFPYEDYTFLADETVTVKESWYNTSKCFSTMRIAIKRQKSTKSKSDIVYLGVCPSTNDEFEIKYDYYNAGCHWWTVVAVGFHIYAALPLICPNRCLTRGPLGRLKLSAPLSTNDRYKMSQGDWPLNKTVQIIDLPDHAVKENVVFIGPPLKRDPPVKTRRGSRLPKIGAPAKRGGPSIGPPAKSEPLPSIAAPGKTDPVPATTPPPKRARSPGTKNKNKGGKKG